MAPRIISLLRASTLILLASLFLAGSTGGAASQGDSSKDPKLDSHLARLVEAAEPAAGFGPPPMPQDLAAMRDASLMRFDSEGRLAVYVYGSGPLEGAARAVRASGGSVKRLSEDNGAVLALVPVAAVKAVAHDSAVRYVGLPQYPVLNAVTEGDHILGVDLVREDYGVDGTGVRIGVISDGIWEYEKSQQSGDLPGDIDYTTCDMVPGWDPTKPFAGGEGTAMLEIVHDLAPGAELWFGSFGMRSVAAGTENDFKDAVNCLAENVDVIVDDISWFNRGPYDGTSDISQNTSNALNDVNNSVRLYATAVGNWGEKHYGGMYEPCDGERHTFRASAGTIDTHGAGPLCANPVEVAVDRSVTVYLQWNDGFGAACNDYDLEIREHNSATVLASSHNPQTCNQDPVEALAWKNTASAAMTVDVVVQKVAGPDDVSDFDLFIVTPSTPGSPALGYYTPLGSVPNQGDAVGGVISVGAIDAGDPGADEIQPYSSKGRPSADGSTKPDITAIDCVNVTGNGLKFSEFCGTSAAAPHIAGIAALLLDCRPGLLAGAGGSASRDRADLSDAILKTADERGEIGPDDVYGFGLVNPLLAAEALCVDSTNLLGDVNCDDTVNSVDALFILRKVGQVEPEATCIDLGDADCDGDVDAVDSLGVLRYVAGIPLAPPDCRPIGT